MLITEALGKGCSVNEKLGVDTSEFHWMRIRVNDPQGEYKNCLKPLNSLKFYVGKGNLRNLHALVPRQLTARPKQEQTQGKTKDPRGSDTGRKKAHGNATG
jgi:hypothetical protein